MKIRKIIILLIIVIIALLGTKNIFATDATNTGTTTPGLELSFSGDKTAKAGETKVTYIYLQAGENIGAVNFKLSNSNNITDLKCTGENGWQILAENDGKYQLVKPAGGNNENVLKVEYTVAENAENEAQITISDITAATVSLKDIEDTDDVITKITIGEGTPSGGNTGNEPGEAPGGESGDNKDSQDTQKEPDSTVANKTINYTGTQSYTFIIIAIISLVGFISYITYKQYRK